MRAAAATSAVPVLNLSSGCASLSLTAARGGPPRVVIVGGGVAGATLAVRLKREGGEGIDVVLIEREPRYVSAPLSNAVVGGWRQLEQLTWGYDGLRRLGVRVVQDEVGAIDPSSMQVKLRDGASMQADRIVVACGAEPVSARIGGYGPDVQALVLHAWQQARQVEALRQRLVRLPDGATVLLSIPRAPYSGQMAPYERACQLATYLRQTRPRARLVVLDANPAIAQAPDALHQVFRQRFMGVIDYRPNCVVTDVGGDGRHVVLEGGERVRADLLNVIPPGQAARLAHEAGLTGADGRWCDVAWPSMASARWPRVHVIGDAVAGPPGMAKSAAMAAAHARWAARSILESLSLRRPEDPPRPHGAIVARQFAFVDSRSALQLTSVHRFDATRGTWAEASGVPADGVDEQGLPLQPGVRGPGDPQGSQALAWARQLWKDMLET
ncbi:MAG: FAD/NAD(P)-binding oxidoreductase [Burkholderiaceae bacterium]